MSHSGGVLVKRFRQSVRSEFRRRLQGLFWFGVQLVRETSRVAGFVPWRTSTRFNQAIGEAKRDASLTSEGKAGRFAYIPPPLCALADRPKPFSAGGVRVAIKPVRQLLFLDKAADLSSQRGKHREKFVIR